MLTTNDRACSRLNHDDATKVPSRPRVRRSSTAAAPPVPQAISESSPSPSSRFMSAMSCSTATRRRVVTPAQLPIHLADKTREAARINCQVALPATVQGDPRHIERQRAFLGAIADNQPGAACGKLPEDLGFGLEFGCHAIE